MWFWLCDDPEISTRMAASWTARRMVICIYYSIYAP